MVRLDSGSRTLWTSDDRRKVGQRGDDVHVVAVTAAGADKPRRGPHLGGAVRSLGLGRSSRLTSQISRGPALHRQIYVAAVGWHTSRSSHFGQRRWPVPARATSAADLGTSASRSSSIPAVRHRAGLAIHYGASQWSRLASSRSGSQLRPIANYRSTTRQLRVGDWRGQAEAQQKSGEVVIGRPRGATTLEGLVNRSIRSRRQPFRTDVIFWRVVRQACGAPPAAGVPQPRPSGNSTSSTAPPVPACAVPP